MTVMSPKLSEVLVKTTHSKDINDALNKIFSEYLGMLPNTRASACHCEGIRLSLRGHPLVIAMAFSEAIS